MLRNRARVLVRVDWLGTLFAAFEVRLMQPLLDLSIQSGTIFISRLTAPISSALVIRRSSPSISFSQASDSSPSSSKMRWRSSL